MKSLDAYTLQARYLPVLVAILPALVLLGTTILMGSGIGIATGGCAATFAALAGQLGRDRGKALQPRLWASWGGSPTLQRLRYRSSTSVERTRRLHERFERVLGEALPTAADEHADPGAADDRYDEAVASVIGIVRTNRDRFGLLFAENVNYGQRRNLLGLRPIGAVIAASGLVITGLLVLLGSGPVAHRATMYAPAAGVAVLSLALWLVVVSPTWARVPAEAYADRLVEAVDVLARETE